MLQKRVLGNLFNNIDHKDHLFGDAPGRGCLLLWFRWSTWRGGCSAVRRIMQEGIEQNALELLHAIREHHPDIYAGHG
jgi:hypothetical protein